MVYKFEQMKQDQATDIAYNWHYEDPYSFYDMEADKEDLAEFLDQDRRGDSTFVVIENDVVIGFFSFNKLTNNTIDIGLGMRPDLTGKGRGVKFIKAGLKFAQTKYEPINVTLSVATFNKRAINTYKKVGFEEVNIFNQYTNGGNFEFVKMMFTY